MSAFTDIERAQKYARVLEFNEAERLGIRVSEAREVIARRLSASPGFLQNLRNNRIKKIPSWLMDKIKEAFIAELKTEIARLENEITIARQTGARNSDDEIMSALAQVQAAKKILGGK